MSGMRTCELPGLRIMLIVRRDREPMACQRTSRVIELLVSSKDDEKIPADAWRWCSLIIELIGRFTCKSLGRRGRRLLYFAYENGFCCRWLRFKRWILQLLIGQCGQLDAAY